MNKCRDCIFFKNHGTIHKVQYWCARNNYPASYQDIACLEYDGLYD